MTHRDGQTSLGWAWAVPTAPYKQGIRRCRGEVVGGSSASMLALVGGVGGQDILRMCRVCRGRGLGRIGYLVVARVLCTVCACHKLTSVRPCNYLLRRGAWAVRARCLAFAGRTPPPPPPPRCLRL